MEINIKILITTISILFLSTSIFAQTDPTKFPLVDRSDIHYLGSFFVPEEDGNGNPISYGGFALGYNPVNNSLFLGCHDWYDLVSEVSIPPMNGTATILQTCTDIYEGNPIDDDENGLHPAGNLVYNGRLISTEIAWYDADYSQLNTHGVSSSLDLSDANNFDGWYSFNGVTAFPRALAGYMTLIPNEWHVLLGGPALTGQAAVSIIGSSSDGPSATVFDPDEVGNSANLHGTTLVFYPIDEFRHPDFEAKGSMVAGMAFPNGTRSVLFFGTRAQHPYCYGTNEDCPYSCFIHKGPHNEFKHAIWAYDANDFLRVKNSEVEPWEVMPYATWEFDDITTGNCASTRFGGATFDQERGILYVVESFGDTPEVHAFQISTPSHSDEIFAENGFKLFPNPFTEGSLNIEIEQPAKMIIGNLLGQKLTEASLESGANMVELDFLPPGLYTITVKKFKGIVSQKFVKH